MDLKTVCVLVVALAVIVAEAKNLDPNTYDDSLPQQRNKRQFPGFGFPGIGGSSSQATAFSSSSSFPGYGGGSGSQAAAFSGSNSYGRK